MSSASEEFRSLTDAEIDRVAGGVVIVRFSLNGSPPSSAYNNITNGISLYATTTGSNTLAIAAVNTKNTTGGVKIVSSASSSGNGSAYSSASVG